MPLLSLLASNPDAIRQLTIEQIVATAGDGSLRDNTESQRELREYLKQASMDLISSYAEHCLSKSFGKAGQVLQDIVNEVGRRLEYNVSNGRYQGTPKEIGFDGIWRDPSGHALVVEVKTTDAYRLSLDTVARYRTRLLSRQDIEDPSSILIVVGRTETGELEAQIRGSRHAWDIRLISVDSLFRLVRVKESTDSVETMAMIRRLLTPLEYTRLDKLVDVVFTTAQDVETSVAAEAGEQPSSPKEAESGVAESRYEFTPSAVIQEIRERIISAVGRMHAVIYIKKSRALYWDSSGSKRVVCTVSKRYDSQGSMKYWYAYHPIWDEFIGLGDEGYFVLGCTDINSAFVLPLSLIREHLREFHTTEKKDGGVYYHIKILENAPDDYSLELPRASDDLPLSPYRISLS